MARWGYYSRRMEALRTARGNQCEECGATETTLEFAHTGETGLWGRGRGLPQRVHDITNHPEKYRLLCRYPCHAKLDGGSGQFWKGRS